MSNYNNDQINIPRPVRPTPSGRQMVKNVCPGRTRKYDREIRTAMGHLQTVEYIAAIFV